MKTKFLLLTMFAALLFACSSEEPDQTVIQNQVYTTESPTLTKDYGDVGSGLTCPPVICDLNYVFPTVPPAGTSYRSLYIEYDTSLTAGEIHCIRQEYFECFALLRYSLVQTTNIHEDHWRIPIGKPGDTVSQTSCNDPRTNQACGD